MKKTYPTYEEAQKIVQDKGIQSMSEYKVSYKELGLPSAPASHYKDAGWIDWYMFLGTKPHSLPPYDEAQRIVQENGIGLISEYLSFYKELGLPSQPHITYRDNGWINWFEFFGKKGWAYPTYEETQRILQEKGINSIPKYKASYKELGLPSAPDRHYIGHGWTGWVDFFAKERKKYPSYEEAQRIVIDRDIKSTREYKASYRELGLPSAPEKHYLEKGWTSWIDFLGKSKQTTQEDRKYNLLKKLDINPVLLKDAPLKVLYIYFSKFRGITDAITSLLGTSSYEERLNWVKEQLNSLKDGSLSKDKSSEEPDELSAMKSVLEENDDVKKALSGEDAERFNILLENYVHSVVNRELISEVDDK